MLGLVPRKIQILHERRLGILVFEEESDQLLQSVGNQGVACQAQFR